MPELAMMLATDLAVLDHADGTVLLIANVLRGGSYDDAVARLDAMATALAAPGAAVGGDRRPGRVARRAAPHAARRTTPPPWRW